MERPVGVDQGWQWPGLLVGGLGWEDRLALAQAGWSWKARARQGGQPRPTRRLCIPRAPRVSAVSIWLVPTFIYAT